MKRIAAAVLTAAAALVLTACGGAEPAETTPVVVGQTAQVEQPAAQETTEAVKATEDAVEAVPVGASQHVESGTMRVVRVEPSGGESKAIIEVSTSAQVTFDGSYTATDAAGTEYAGTPALDAPSANGIGGWFVTFPSGSISTVTYQPTDGPAVSWTAG